jgi:hypothetical protein
VRERRRALGRREAVGGLLVVPVVLAVLGCWAAGDAPGLESVPARLGRGRPGRALALALGADAGTRGAPTSSGAVADGGLGLRVKRRVRGRGGGFGGWLGGWGLFGGRSG